MIINEIYNNFKLISKEFVKEENSDVLIFEHIATKAKLIKLVNEDPNKTFGIGFRTPPNNSTGVAHILEHTVLNGSKKYTTREPFMDLLKSSLQTFLNAMTFSDKTIYPVASRNDKDFHNLIDVYLDAVFNPRIYDIKEIFMQEGWHYELNNAESDIEYKGVVYNEMKGAMSSAEDQVMDKLMRTLYPDTIYKYNSGGDPYEIPKLKYEEFLDFHTKYYHPSNSYIFLYGNGDTIKELAHIDKFIDEYDYLKVDSNIDKQEPFKESKIKVEYYSMSKEESSSNKSYLSYSCCLGDTTDVETLLMNEILNETLIESQASPIRKALLSEGVCEDIIASYSDGIHQTFGIIAKNSSSEDLERFNSIVSNVLLDIVSNGIDSKLLEASVNKIEFSLREKADHSARGVLSFITALNTWLYDDNPVKAFKYEEPLSELKSKLSSGYFEKYIENKVMNNPHKTLLIVKPDPGLYDRLDCEVKQELESMKSNLTNLEIEELINDNKKLSDFQTRIDSDKDKDTIPKLSLSDINTKIERIDLDIEDLGNSKLLHLNEFTNSVDYINILFNIDYIPYEDVQYLSLLSYLLGNMDTKNYDYSSLSNEIYLNSGGISANVSINSDFYTKELYPKFVISAKCLSDKLAETINLIEEITINSKLDNKKRLKEMILELKSKIEMTIYDSGHSVAINRVMSYFQPSAYYDEKAKGLDFFFFIQELDNNFEKEYDNLVKKLNELYEKIFNKNNLLIHLTMNSNDYDIAKNEISKLISKYSKNIYQKCDYSIENKNLNEGISSSSSVQYVSKGFDLSKYGIEYEGSMEVLANILNMEYLHNQIRAIGGAYGAGIKFYTNGSVGTYSYRDPNLKKTIDVYDNIGTFIDNLELSKEDLESSIIGSMKSFDPLLTIRIKAGLSLSRYISNVKYETLDKYLNQAINTNLEKLKSYSKPLSDAMSENYLVTLGNEKNINENKNLFKNIIKLKK